MGLPRFSEYVFLGPLDILPDLINQKGRIFEPDFIPDSSYKIDLNLLAIDIAAKI